MEETAEITPELEPSTEEEIQPQEANGETTEAEPEQEESPEHTETEAATGKTSGLDPKGVRQVIRSASESAPEQASALKELGNAYFREQAYRSHFATPEEAGSVKNLVDSVGGIDGIAALQERDSLYTMQDDFLRDGNPEVLDDIFEDFPEGAAALAPHYLERLQKSNPDAFNAAVSPYAVGMLENAGISQFLESILREPDAERSKAMVQQLAQWYAEQRNGVRNLPKAAAPRTDSRLQAERDSIAQEREQIFSDGVATRVNTAIAPQISSIVTETAKKYGLSQVQSEKFTAALQARLVAEMNADENYKKQVNLHRRSAGAKPQSVADYISGEIKRRLPAIAFKEAQETWGTPKNASGQKTGLVKAGSPKTSRSGGPLFVSQRPAQSSLDMSKPDAELMLIAGKAYLKDGRFVTWRK